jgi:hypothetical protein
VLCRSMRVAPARPSPGLPHGQLAAAGPRTDSTPTVRVSRSLRMLHLQEEPKFANVYLVILVISLL